MRSVTVGTVRGDLRRNKANREHATTRQKAQPNRTDYDEPAKGQRRRKQRPEPKATEHKEGGGWILLEFMTTEGTTNRENLLEAKYEQPSPSAPDC